MTKESQMQMPDPKPGELPQLTQSDMDRLSPEQKVAAYEAGQFDVLLGRDSTI